MELTITKDDFEKALPAGMNAHSSVFEAIEPAIEEAVETASEDILGSAGEEKFDDSATLQRWFIKYVCLTGFLNVLRQLDLVLTQSGFGIVSSDNVAPASQSRVDELEKSLRTAQVCALARVLTKLRSEEWGVTDQAVINVPYIYSEAIYFYRDYVPGRTYEDWAEMKKSVIRADEVLRMKISDAQMDAVMTAYRCGDSSTYVQLNKALRDFTVSLHERGEHDAIIFTLPRVMRILESDLEKYTEWANSKEYAAFHEERFQNTGDSPAYIFG